MEPSTASVAQQGHGFVSWNASDSNLQPDTTRRTYRTTSTHPDGDGDDGANQQISHPDIKKKQTKSQVSHVFFMIGSQRSGSNWLRTMLGEREDMIAPHPPHIMRDIVPIIDKFGDLDDQKNLKILIDHVCAFVEHNQVPWLNLHAQPIKFNRSIILAEVLLSLECFLFKEKLYYTKNGQPTVLKIDDNRYYLLAIFDAIMNAMAKANGKSLWMCKSMGMSQYHDLLLNFYGEERLRYIYLVRDPRDVCLSFLKTPVGDCHPYAIAKKWAKLQNFAARIQHENPNLIHEVCYETLLFSKDAQVAKILDFIGAREVSRTMRRGSIVAIKSESEVVQGAKHGRDAYAAHTLSYQFKNLTRGDSFTKGQFKKWATEMNKDDMLIVESVAFAEMTRLGYEPYLVKTEDERIHFSEQTISKYDSENMRLIAKMYNELAIENPDDLKRRQIQASVLKTPTSVCFDEDFIKSAVFDIKVDDDLDRIDAIAEQKKFKEDLVENFDFASWPSGAEQIGFMQADDVARRLCVNSTNTTAISKSLSITYASASQGGYYPNDNDKQNQDSLIAGSIVAHPNNPKERGVFFAVFDGHGPAGTDCAEHAKEDLFKYYIDGLKGIGMPPSIPRQGSLVDLSDHSLPHSFRRSSFNLEEHETIDASQSGTTATCLLVTKDSLLTAHVGDSRCILIRHSSNNKVIVDALTKDHSPEREDELERIAKAGGVVMSSEQFDVQDTTLPSLQPKRVWSKDGKWPGTAFTRSLGDGLAKRLGVCADPECKKHPIPLSRASFVIGSDGVFDFIPDQEIASIVTPEKDPAQACRELIGKSWHRWSESEERVDDITVIVGHIECSQNFWNPVFRKLSRFRMPGRSAK